MDKKQGISAGIVAIATVIGGALGTVAGLLLAPQSGQKTREKIAETYKSTAENIGSVTTKIDDTVSGIVKKVAPEVKELPTQVKNGVSGFAKEAGDVFSKTVEKGTSYFGELTESVSASVEEGKKKFLDKKEQFITKK